MEWITVEDLENISNRCNVAGNGRWRRSICRSIDGAAGASKIWSVKVLQVEDLDDDALVMPVGSVGVHLLFRTKLLQKKNSMLLPRY